MVLEEQIPPFVEWLLGTPTTRSALQIFMLATAVVIIGGTFLGFVRKAMQLGPSEGFYAVAKVYASAVVDFQYFSLLRVGAMARLAVQEAIRRRVLVVFAVFLVILLFAGWYLDAKSDHPATVYLSFVLTATNYLILPISLFLAAFSLPNDIKTRVIYTLVTKPIRASEIVLGRILGFTLVGTVILAMMCGISYAFVVRGLNHAHEVELESLVPTENDKSILTGTTTLDAYHRHVVTIGADGKGRTDVQLDHWHEVTRVGEGANAKYVVGPPRGTLQARVPVYGKLHFLDRQGKPAAEGVNVGNEWAYRSFIEGNTLSAGIWEFSNIREADFKDGLPLELTLRVFRTHKGNIERGIPGTIVVRNPSLNAKIKQSSEFTFTAKEFATDQQFIPRKLKARDVDGKLQEVDLFEDLVHEGKFLLEIRCTAGGQYFGMAQADVYLRASDRSFALNFIKGYLGIWMQMVLVTSYGVMFSTFLSGAVAMIATIGSIILGFFRQFLADVASGAQVGGGPLESLIRIPTQMSISVELDMHPRVEAAVKWADWLWLQLMNLGAMFLPNYGGFNNAAYVAYGFDLSGDLLLAQLCRTMSYFVVVTFVAYFCFKTREVAA